MGPFSSLDLSICTRLPFLVFSISSVAISVISWLGAFAALGLLWIFTHRLSRIRGLKYLPGPPGIPLIGNILQMPRSHEWVEYARWGKTYGPVVQARVFRESIVIINSHQAAVELLEKKSTIYSDRPRLVMAGELIGWNRGVTLIESGERHRRYRRLLQSTLSKSGSCQFQSLQQQEVYGFLQRLLTYPEQHVSHIRRVVAGSIVRIAYGHVVESNEDKYIVEAEDAQAKFSIAATPNTYLVDSLPLLKLLPNWLPGLEFRRNAYKWRIELDDLARRPFQRVQQDMELGIALPSYVSRLLDKIPQRSVQDEEDIMFSALSLYTGGADTTVSSIHTFFLAMVLYPIAQTKARAELDQVVGRDRLPTFSDRDNLPYLNACVKEVFRWSPALPLGVAHKNRVADEYDGYYIPAGSTVITNIWAMMRDESVYSEPTSFQPERWLRGELDSIQHNFGFGRRICPGMWTADASLFIVIACVLATFEVKPPLDQNGEEMFPHVKYTTGMISHPEPFDVRILPRDDRAIEVVNNRNFS